MRSSGATSVGWARWMKTATCSRARGAEQPAVEDEPGSRRRLHGRAGKRRHPGVGVGDRGSRRARDGLDRSRAHAGLERCCPRARASSGSADDEMRIGSPEASSSMTPGASGSESAGSHASATRPRRTARAKRCGGRGEQVDVALVELGLARPRGRGSARPRWCRRRRRRCGARGRSGRGRAGRGSAGSAPGGRPSPRQRRRLALGAREVGELVHVLDRVLVVRQEREPVGQVLQAVLGDQVRARVERVPAGAVERDGPLQAAPPPRRRTPPAREREGRAVRDRRAPAGASRTLGCALAVIALASRRREATPENSGWPTQRASADHRSLQHRLQEDSDADTNRRSAHRGDDPRGGPERRRDVRADLLRRVRVDREPPQPTRSSRARRSSRASRSATMLANDGLSPASSPSATVRCSAARSSTSAASIAGIGPVTVDPAAQDDGVGRALMEAVLRRERDRGVAGIRLVQTAYHYRSLALYAKLGFVVREPLSVVQGTPPALSDPRPRRPPCAPRRRRRVRRALRSCPRPRPRRRAAGRDRRGQRIRRRAPGADHAATRPDSATAGTPSPRRTRT